MFNKRPYKCIPTNINVFDNLIGGGLPQGKIIELVGEPDIGKTTFLFDIIEKASNDVLIAYITTSPKSFNFLKSRKLDKKDNLLICLTNDETHIKEFIRSSVKIVDIFIIDSIPDIMTENEKYSFDLNEGQNVPKLLSDLNTLLYGENCSLIAINHTIFKNNISVPRWDNMFQRYCSIRVEILDKTHFKVLSHKTLPYLVGGGNNEL